MISLLFYVFGAVLWGLAYHEHDENKVVIGGNEKRRRKMWMFIYIGTLFLFFGHLLSIYEESL